MMNMKRVGFLVVAINLLHAFPRKVYSTYGLRIKDIESGIKNQELKSSI
jgi:hypothetical protein